MPRFRGVRQPGLLGAMPPVPPPTGKKDIGARIYNSGDLSIDTATWTGLTFNSERWDDDGFHSIVANTSRFTIRHASSYLFTGSIQWDASATGVRLVAIRLNNVPVAIALTQPEAAIAAYQRVCTIYALTPGDYAELFVYHTHTVSLDVVAAGNWSPEFVIQRL